MDFMGVGMGELLLIALLALVVLGPERLPEVAGQVGRTVADLRRQASVLTEEFQSSLSAAAEERKQQRLETSVPPPAASTAVAATGPYCSSCGVRAQAGARFCASCGVALGQPIVESASGNGQGSAG